MENQAALLSLYNYCIMCAWCLGRPHKITMNLNTVTKHNTYIVLMQPYIHVLYISQDYRIHAN